MGRQEEVSAMESSKDIRGELLNMPKETLVDLLEIANKNFWSLQGRWFLFVEETNGLDVAMEGDERVFSKVCETQARRIKNFFNLNGDIPSLVKAIKFSQTEKDIEFEFPEISDRRCELRITNCPMQLERKEKGMPSQPCKDAGLFSFRALAKVINPDFRVNCILCPPDPVQPGVWCAWEFLL
jgi:hypothetical protein